MRKYGRRFAVAVAGLVLLAATATPARADTTRDAEWHVAYLNVSAAQQLSQGQGTVVAVVDTGVDAHHPDLVGNVLPGTDYFDPVDKIGWIDAYGHGTAMAGLIAGHGHNGGGVLGIAPKAQILPVRV